MVGRDDVIAADYALVFHAKDLVEIDPAEADVGLSEPVRSPSGDFRV